MKTPQLSVLSLLFVMILGQAVFANAKEELPQPKKTTLLKQTSKQLKSIAASRTKHMVDIDMNQGTIVAKSGFVIYSYQLEDGMTWNIITSDEVTPEQVLYYMEKKEVMEGATYAMACCCLLGDEECKPTIKEEGEEHSAIYCYSDRCEGYNLYENTHHLKQK